MAEGGKNVDYDTDTVETQFMDFSDYDYDEEYLNNVLPAENRFGDISGHPYGRGSVWKRTRQQKRKKVSSTESTDSLDMKTFNALSNNDKLSYLFENTSRNVTVLEEVKTEQTTLNHTTKELKYCINVLCEQTRVSENIIQHQTKCIKMLAYRAIDADSKSRRENLIVWGISERSTLQDKTLMLNFFEDEMDVNTSDIVIENVERIGSRTNQRNSYHRDLKRPIIVKFKDVSDTDRVMRKAFTLKGSPFGIDRDYPREIATARRELYESDVAKRARLNRDRLQIRYPAKLFINGNLICDKFPEWNKYVNVSRVSCFDFNSSLHVGSEITSPGHMTTRNGLERVAAYQMDTDEDGPSSVSGDEQGHDVNSSVFTRSGMSSKGNGVKNAIIINNHSGDAHLSYSDTKINNVSCDSDYKHSDNKQRNLPKAMCSKSDTNEVNRKSTKKNKVTIHKGVTSNVNNRMKTNIFSIHESDTRTRRHINQPIDTGSKNSDRGKPTHTCTWYGPVGLIATENSDTWL